MERKFITIAGLIVILLVFSLYLGCGFFENDQTEYQKDVIGKIKIQKQENSKSKNLVYAESGESYAGIVDDCIAVFFDLTNNTIYAECKLNKSQNNYYEVKVIDPNSNFISSAVKKRKISSLVFSLKIKGLMEK